MNFLEQIKNQAAAEQMLHAKIIQPAIDQKTGSNIIANILAAKRTERQRYNEMMEILEREQEEARRAQAPSLETTLSKAIAANTELQKINIGLDKLKKDVDDLSAEPDADVEDNIADEDTAQVYADEVEAKEKGTQESFALSVVLNEMQNAAKDLAFAGKSFALTGPAGSGKTTAQRAIAKALLEQDQLSTSVFKTYNKATGEREYISAPSIAFCAFTRRAASNLAKAIHKDPLLAEELENNIMTIHALLEYEPETYIDYSDPDFPHGCEKFRFAPKRDAKNPLTITHLIIEESSMLDAMTLWRKLYDALPSGVQIIFIGDINQLPPVFGPSILNYALVQLPVIELKTVYRNQGIILENAHRILKGQFPIEDENFVIVRGKSPVQVGQQKLSVMLGNLFNQWMEITGSDGLPEYDPADCMILSPFGKQECGTKNLNNWIAQHIGAKRGAIVHEVIAGFNKLYLAVGDKVMVNKMDGVITDIQKNASYHGKEPQFPGSDLTRFGNRIIGEGGKDDMDDLVSMDYSNFNLESLEQEKANRVQQASHKVTVQLETGEVESMIAAGDFSDASFSLGYVLTVHKAQGSEWRKVFIVLHKDHATMLYRELFYTAETRARTKVTLIAKDAVIEKALANQRIKGESVEEKIAFFNSGIFDNIDEPIYATKN